MKIVVPNDIQPTYFDPNKFFSTPLDAKEPVMKFLIPLVGQETEDALGTLDKSLYSDNYIPSIVERYLVKQNENPPFKYLDVHIFTKKEEKEEQPEQDSSGRKPATMRPAAKASMARHSGNSDEIDFDYLMKHGHIKGIFVI